ncbi:MAG: hypothetical protein BWZ03_00365 [bacterium ADurb.BinA186]|nr:MAG: hypothetical protein BWZ03_00365 [bacterium ADurb.BinA186]
MNAFIIPSRGKGMGLVELINNLRDKKPVSYHTLFPPKVLTKQFVLEAFKKAFISNKLNQLRNKNIHDTNLDFKKSLFYVEYEGFKVAGYFIPNQSKNEFKIKTCFPDLSWYYRIEFTHRQIDPFSIDRFFTYSAEEGYWLQHGTSRKNYSQNDTAYCPSPRASLSRALVGNESQMMTPKLWLAMENVSRSLKQEHLKQEALGQTYSVFSFFFDDPTQVTRNELISLSEIIKKLIPAFKLKPKKINSIEQIVGEIERLQNISGFVKFAYFHAEKTGDPLSQLCDISIPFNAEQGYNHFAEELAHQMLALNIASFYRQKNHAYDNWMYDLGQKFHRNMLKKLADSDQTIAILQQNMLVLDMSNTEMDICPYALSIISIDGITGEAIFGQKVIYRMLFAINRQASNQYELGISSIIQALSRNAKYGSNALESKIED